MTARGLLPPLDIMSPPSVTSSSTTFVLGVVVLLLLINFYEDIPPVTLGVMAVLLAAHRRLFDVFDVKLTDVCMNTNLAWKHDQYYRVFVSSFYHGNDYHLAFSLLSFYVKGSSLEEYFGSYLFFLLVAWAMVLVNVVTIPLSFALEQYVQNSSYINRCTLGFSGVIFALKVISTFSYRRGLLVNWVELPILCLLMPQLACLGNCSGLIVGSILVFWIRRLSNYHVGAAAYSSYYNEGFGPERDPSRFLWPLGSLRRPVEETPERYRREVFDNNERQRFFNDDDDPPDDDDNDDNNAQQLDLPRIEPNPEPPGDPRFNLQHPVEEIRRQLCICM